MEDAAAQQPKQEEVSTSNPPSEVRKGPMQPPEEPTEVETSAAPVPGAAVSTKTTQEMVSPEPPAAAKRQQAELRWQPLNSPRKMKRAKRTQVPQLAEAPPQSHLQRRRSLGNRCIRATQRKNGKNGGRHKTSQLSTRTSKNGSPTRS